MAQSTLHSTCGLSSLLLHYGMISNSIFLLGDGLSAYSWSLKSLAQLSFHKSGYVNLSSVSMSAVELEPNSIFSVGKLALLQTPLCTRSCRKYFDDDDSQPGWLLCWTRRNGRPTESDIHHLWWIDFLDLHCMLSVYCGSSHVWNSRVWEA